MERYNENDTYTIVSKYMNKLKSLIERDSAFRFGTASMIDKYRTDDLLCCIEASFEEQYSDIRKYSSSIKLNADKSYRKINDYIKAKHFLVPSNYYWVDMNILKDLIKEFLDQIRADERRIQQFLSQQ